VLSDDSQQVAALTSDAEKVDFNLQIANCGYDCSTLVDHFRPDFIVIDCSLGSKEAGSIVRHLVRDPRIPFVRLVIAGHEDEFPSECDEGVFGRIERPFHLDDINQFIDSKMPQSRNAFESQVKT
jgi:DNA-binding NtrC family response regulator